MTRPRMNQRKALCMAFGWDYADAEEYQGGWSGRHRKGNVRVPHRIKVYNVGNGFGVALRDDEKLHAGLIEHFGQWRKVDSFAGWSTYVTEEAK